MNDERAKIRGRSLSFFQETIQVFFLFRLQVTSELQENLPEEQRRGRNQNSQPEQPQEQLEQPDWNRTDRIERTHVCPPVSMCPQL